MGFKIVRLDPNGNPTDGVIVNYTKSKFNPSDPDSVVVVDFNLGGYIRFSNSIALLGGAEPAPGTQPETLTTVRWDPPGETRPRRGFSQATTFGTEQFFLSSRDEGYQRMVVDWFIFYVLGSYLTPRHYFIDPTPDVLETMSKIDPERPPESEQDIMAILQIRPDLIRSITCVEETFNLQAVSPALRGVVRHLLENRGMLEEYMATSDEGRNSLIDGWQESSEAGELTAGERFALLQAAVDRRELMGSAYDHIELGRGPGDENTYILIGNNFGPDLQLFGGTPARFDAWRWVVEQLEEFETLNGFIPAFGPYVTEARMRYRVIIGPGVSDREVEFLRFHGHELIDRRDGSDIGKLDEDVVVK
jgi:hypothetical protein